MTSSIFGISEAMHFKFSHVLTNGECQSKHNQWLKNTFCGSGTLLKCGAPCFVWAPMLDDGPRRSYPWHI